MTIEQNNISQNIFDNVDEEFIKEFKQYAVSQNMIHQPTFEAMNAFCSDEWKKFTQWKEFRASCGGYQYTVEWEFDEKDMMYYYPYNHILSKENPTVLEKKMLADIFDAMETENERRERMIGEGKWFCIHCHGAPDEVEDWIRVDCCDHGCSHSEH